MKNNIGLVDYCKAQLGRPYWYGTYGNISTEELYKKKRKQYLLYYIGFSKKSFEDQYGQKVHDCGGLIKGYLMSADANSPAVYNKMYDKVASSMCLKQQDIKTIPEIPGICVFKTGHVGVYIGNGEVIEAKGHQYGVVQTKLATGKWTKWAKLTVIEYINDSVAIPNTKKYIMINAISGVWCRDIKNNKISVIPNKMKCELITKSIFKKKIGKTTYDFDEIIYNKKIVYIPNNWNIYL